MILIIKSNWKCYRKSFIWLYIALSLLYISFGFLILSLADSEDSLFNITFIGCSQCQCYVRHHLHALFASCFYLPSRNCKLFLCLDNFVAVFVAPNFSLGAWNECSLAFLEFTFAVAFDSACSHSLSLSLSLSRLLDPPWKWFMCAPWLRCLLL